MAINDKDFYASHGISFDIEEMQIEYTKRVINQAKIEVLTELKSEIEENVLAADPNTLLPFLQARETCVAVIQEKINKLRGKENE